MKEFIRNISRAASNFRKSCDSYTNLKVIVKVMKK